MSDRTRWRRRLEVCALSIGSACIPNQEKTHNLRTTNLVIGLAELLLTLRSKAGLSQEVLAERSGVSARTISDIERGLARAPRAMTLSLLEEALALAPADRTLLRDAVRQGRPHGTAGAPATAPLIGRDTELATIQALLADSRTRLVTVTGGAGVGKTALASAHAARSGPATANIVTVELASVPNAELVPLKVAQAVGARTVGPASLALNVARAIGHRRALLVLDNFEHVAGAAPFVAELLAAAPSLQVLATSRTPLRLSSERVVQLSPLDQAGAIGMLVERATARESTFRSTDENAPALAELARMLRGVPLAIELAAPQLGQLGPGELVRRLERPIPVLVAHGDDVPERQRTLGGAIAWSYELLSPSERRAFRSFAVFGGRFTVPAAQAVLAVEGDAATLETLRLLGPLVDQNLLRTVDADDDSRFEFFPFVRTYAMELLEQANEVFDAHVRLAKHCMAIAGLLVRPDPATHTRENRDRLEVEAPNFDSVLAWAVSAGRIELGLRLAFQLWFYWWLRGSYLEGLAWMRSLLGNDGGLAGIPEDLLGQAYAEATGLAEVAGLLEEADRFSERALMIAQHVGNRTTIAAILSGTGVRAGLRGRFEDATRFHTQAVEMRRSDGHVIGLAQALLDLGTHMAYCGDPAAAVEHLEESLHWYRQRNSRLGIALVLGVRGELAFGCDDLDQAESFSRTSLEIAREVGHSGTAGTAAATLGRIAFRRGAHATAEMFLRDAFDALEAADDLGSTPDVLEAFCGLALAHGDPVRAAQLLGLANDQRHRLGFVMRPLHRAEHERIVRNVRAVLSSEAFEAALATGATSDVDVLLADLFVQAKPLTPPLDLGEGTGEQR